MRYRLPDALGGGEIEAEEFWGGCAGGQPEYRLGGGLVVLAPPGQPFEKVAPPLPAEPPLWTPVLVRDHEVFQRQPRGSGSAYSHAGFEEDYTWAEVCAGDVPRVLVPVPEPVELPWRGGPLSVAFNPHGLGLDGPHKVVVEVGGSKVHVLASVARAAGRALWTAADAAENGGAS